MAGFPYILGMTVGKFAKQAAEPSSIPWAGAKGLLGYGLLRSGLPRVTGMQPLYHGTSAEAWKSILREGLRAGRGGSARGATMSLGKAAPAGMLEAVKNLVHMTRSPSVARFHTHFAAGSPLAAQISPLGAMGRAMENPGAAIKANLRAYLTAAKGGKVVSTRVPYAQYLTEFKADPGWGGRKGLASTTSKDIAPHYIKGTGSRNRLKFLLELLRKLPRYAQAHPGHFAAGAGLTAAGGALAYSAIRNILRRVRGQDVQPAAT